MLPRAHPSTAVSAELSCLLGFQRVYNLPEVDGLASDLLVPGRTVLAIVLPFCYPLSVWVTLA
jgi:hypothetical protein